MLMAMQSRQCSSETCSNGPTGPATPTLLTSTSHPPRTSMERASHWVRAVSSRTSTSSIFRDGWAVWVWVTASGLRSQVQTCAPWFKNASDIVAPRPLPPAVMITRITAPFHPCAPVSSLSKHRGQLSGVSKAFPGVASRYSAPRIVLGAQERQAVGRRFEGAGYTRGLSCQDQTPFEVLGSRTASLCLQ